jgi:ectoine hydroxylase-related dioxygenase (phytanoyl-CoA dioxygenase family)
MKPTMNFAEAMHWLGVRNDTLSREEKSKLDRDGFVALPYGLTPEQAARMRAAAENQFIVEKTGTDAPGAQAECGQLQCKSDVFDICVTHPRVLAAVWHVLREDFCSLGVHSRPNPPGKGHQGLHMDTGWEAGSPPAPGEYWYCNSMWPLADFSRENGATRIVPGSHLKRQSPNEAGVDPLAPHPDEVFLVAPVGTVIVFNAHAWHAACLNRSNADRPNVTSFWSRKRGSFQRSFPSMLSPLAAQRFSSAARELFRTD